MALKKLYLRFGWNERRWSLYKKNENCKKLSHKGKKSIHLEQKRWEIIGNEVISLYIGLISFLPVFDTCTRNGKQMVATATSLNYFVKL